jgi:hypothetical protein
MDRGLAVVDLAGCVNDHDHIVVDVLQAGG